MWADGGPGYLLRKFRDDASTTVIPDLIRDPTDLLYYQVKTMEITGPL